MRSPYRFSVTLLLIAALHTTGCETKEETVPTDAVSADQSETQTADGEELPDDVDVPDQGEVSEMCFVDFPCFQTEGASCVAADPNVMAVRTSYGCERYCGSSPCSGGACEETQVACASDELCATDEAAQALCVPASEVCGGPNAMTCPAGQVCHHGRFYATNTYELEPECAGFQAGLFGHCVPAPACDPSPSGAPICGCNGVQYPNECALQFAGVPASSSTDCLALAPGECLSQFDCKGNGESCAHADADNVCGMCREMPSCADDSECAGTPDSPVCDQRPMCLCSPGPVCLAACTSDDECTRDEVCQPSGHCELRSCDEGCPLTFSCDTASNLCLRKSCTSAADCETMDFCVNGTCDEAIGACSLPVP